METRSRTRGNNNNVNNNNSNKVNKQKKRRAEAEIADEQPLVRNKRQKTTITSPGNINIMIVAY